MSPFAWNKGEKPDASVIDVQSRLSVPDVTIRDIRDLIGDTDSTIIQAKVINAEGAKDCGWKVPTK